MATTFHVLSIGQLGLMRTGATDNETANNWEAVWRATTGSVTAPIEYVEWSPGSTHGGTGYNNQQNGNPQEGMYYNNNTSVSGGETFRINGGPDQTFFMAQRYNITLTYADGSLSVQAPGWIVQDTLGNTYLVPPSSLDTTAGDSAFRTQFFEAENHGGSVVGVRIGQLTSQSGNYGLYADREPNVITPPAIPCFVSGTSIATSNGPINVEDLSIGDLVLTIDNDYQPIRWIGKRTLSAEEIVANPKLRPIRIKAQALGGGQPHSDLMVSPQHRILIRSRIAQRMFGASEVLVSAKQLVGIDGVETTDFVGAVTYVHFMCDDHQIVFSNGAVTESMLPGAVALRAVGKKALDEILAIFPQLLDEVELVPARKIAPNREARRMIARHSENSKALVS